MSKITRNTIFTALVLVLTGLGVTWNKEIAETREPIAIGQAVLAESESRAPNTGDFPLRIELSRSVIRLGQYQVLTVETEPFADLDIVTVDPLGEINRPETLRATADETGRYQLRFQLSDFHQLGTFRITVKAMINQQTAYTAQNFTLQTWSFKESAEPKFLYPILP